MKRTIVSALLAFAVLPLAACGLEPAPSEDFDDGAFAVDQTADNWTYFVVTGQDTRRCISPVCGGVYVKRLNQPKTKCLDGTWQKECYVGSFDFSAIGYSSDEQATAMGGIHAAEVVLRGTIKAGLVKGFEQVPGFVATEVWRAPNGKDPTGIFYRVTDSGIRCITTPCGSLDGLRLNRNANPLERYAGLDLSAAGATDEQNDAAWNSLNGTGVVVAGKVVTIKGPAGTGQSIVASQYFTRVLPAPMFCGGRGGRICPEGYYCQFTNELCGKADGGGQCEKQPEICTEQWDPVCGCDNVTYGNDCMRQAAGVGFGTPGACAE